MGKINKQSLDGIIKTINKNIIASFLILLIFFVVFISVVFVNYKNNEKKFILQKLNATFSTFTTEISQKLIGIITSEYFRIYINSGLLTRERLYPFLLININSTNLLNVIAGMEIFDSSATNIFSYGVKTDDFIVLDLCFLNRSLVSFGSGTCSYAWKLYFKQDAIVKELKRINPELTDCSNCGKEIILGKYFGEFPILQVSIVKINLGIKKNPSIVLWEIVFFAMNLLLILVLWNINRIKKVFKNYLSDPIIEIASRIKENKNLPKMEVEELSYLTQQIDQWKKQVVELEKTAAQEKVKENKVKVMQSIGASVAHELRTPLRSIISGVQGIEKFLPVLLKSYDSARGAGLVTEVIRPQQIELLHKVLANLKTEGASANTIIDMLLMKIRGTVTGDSDVKLLSITECINDALKRYAFQESEKNLVICDTTNDFQFKGDAILVVHILFNLLKNALYYIARARKGQIYIHLENRENENRLYFKDTGKGIAKEMLSHIFNRFYSKTDGGVGIGLSFCKMAMEWMGGSITCQSVEGEYTEFVLHFPIPKE
ncbi:MAG: hypothetical protein A2V89_04750 [Gammaproteobacteria bacterium RBG_16_37_9]|nr:MAG: hypothetical protein A2V89_04750 [Gammaproteobacteria bacterium RBG_16_37_9]